MNLRFFDWIWHVRGIVPLAPGQSSEDAFDRLNPLFCQYGTSQERTNDTLVFRKKDQAAQDKMSVFDGGVLEVQRSVSGSVLRYRLASKAVLFCFLMPLFFIGIAQFTIALGDYQKPSPQAAKAEAEAAKKLAAKKVDVPMNPIDKALGAPAPDKPKAAKGAPEGGDKKSSPTSAYVFASIFALLYVVGRVLEDRLIKAQFRKHLLGI